MKTPDSPTLIDSHRGGCDRDRFSGRLDACQENGRPGGPLSRHGEKIHVPGVDFPEKGNIMVHIEQAEPLKQLIPNTAVSGALSFLREKTER